MRATRDNDIVRFLLTAAAALALIAVVPLAAFAQVPGQPPVQDRTAGPATPNAPAPPAAPIPHAPASAKWTGFYVGGVFGSARSTADATTTTVFSPFGYLDTTSPGAIAMAGAQALSSDEISFGAGGGFNFQLGPIVFGGEADYQRMALSDTRSSSGIYPSRTTTGFTVTQSIDTTSLVTLRGRAGVAAGPILLFGTVGIAITDLNYQAVFTDTFGAATENGGVKAWQQTLIYGGGAEFRGGPHWSIKGEYLRGAFDTVSATSTNLMAFTPPIGPIAFPSNPFTHSLALNLNVIRGGVNFRF